MVLVGLVLILLGALAIVAAVFTADVKGTGHVELLGIHMSALALFLVGVVAGVLILWGLPVLRWGSKRSWAKRREQKRLNKLASEVDAVDAKRRESTDQEIRDAENDDRRTL